MGSDNRARPSRRIPESSEGPTLMQHLRTCRTVIGELLCIACIAGLVAGCGETCVESCPPNVEYGIHLRVTDSETGTALACCATAWIRDGAYIDSLEASSCWLPESLQTGSMVGAQERPGTYEVFVERPGYAPWHRAGIEVRRRKCSCHVEPVSVEARLIPQ